ncbi:hypothetical protein [Microvirga sp. BSC39]|uniref:hypothetical protein n=1 Tax=Microvirga sp. BSC39 TaxID=1549810 RepID=UPI0004E8C4F6|nr:hypothetical protein [Microvirga sp. BSC39]KFG70227.1 hypothetical protein JH26_05695 [Microvirga sp. BSC39]
MANVSFARDLAQVPPELNGTVDLCLHSDWLSDSGLAPQKALMRVDALLSSHGEQIFTVSGLKLKWHVLKRPLRTHAFIEWLRQRGWGKAASFKPESAFGEDAGATFVCQDTGYVTDSVIVLPKASAKADRTT